MRHFKTRLRAKGQVTLPAKLREHLDVTEGDDVGFFFDENGRVIVQKVQTIPPDQAWFWTERWQKLEQEVQEEIESGEVRQFDSVDEALEHLDSEDF